MIEVLLDVCGHYSSTHTFRNSEGIERERVAAQREFSERKFFQNNAVKSFSVVCNSEAFAFYL